MTAFLLKKMRLLLSLAAFLGCFPFAVQAQQIYLDNNSGSSQNGETRNIFVQPQTSSRTKVFTPQIYQGDQSQQSTSENKPLQKKDYTAKLPPSQPREEYKPQKKQVVCTDRERALLKKMEAMDNKYIQVSSKGAVKKVNRDGSVSFTYSKESQDFIDKYKATYSALRADKAKYQKYIDLRVRCSQAAQ